MDAIKFILTCKPYFCDNYKIPTFKMKKKSKIEKYTDQEALDYHNSGKSGKIEINSSKPMSTQRDLALAYSPGVAAPVKIIAENPDAAYDYTTKGIL